MNIVKRLTINLTEDDVRAIVAAYLVQEGFNVTKHDVTLVVENEYLGYGLGEYRTARFQKCVVDVKKGE